MNVLYWTMASLCLLLGPAGDSFQTKTEELVPEWGYSYIRYNFDHDDRSIPLTIHKDTGCILILSRPYDDAWSSDANGNATGAFYKYAQWGTTPSGAPDFKKLIISNVNKTKTTQNLFLLFGDHVLEITLDQTDEYQLADRRVVFELLGGEPKPIQKRPVPPAPSKPDELLPYLAKLASPDNRHIAVPHGRLTYQFEKAPFFFYFTPLEGAPDVEILELTRGKRSGKHFQYEIPLSPELNRDLGRSTFQSFQNFELDKGERLYLRIKVKGERSAKPVRLKKPRRS
ncbi:hypothetical protein [Acanthopleuribacter pedis]|uniref:Uncharacterized protein n=1 Tax=Acanthopleuribacter pedis TaxID=442870 RepID=A0A8J7QLK3_9BACT|nr:hypothetical protein [Acanthopleuribacter pedis]MBO1323396.1 hypothetical protein [Acanthopleuribacter pedis]